MGREQRMPRSVSYIVVCFAWLARFGELRAQAAASCGTGAKVFPPSGTCIKKLWDIYDAPDGMNDETHSPTFS